VSFRYQEIPCGPVPSPASKPAFAWIEETCVVALVNAVAAPRLALARLALHRGQMERRSVIRSATRVERMDLTLTRGCLAWMKNSGSS
jgi:hypothetical protein